MLWAARICGAAAVVCGVLAVVEYVREQRMNRPEPPWVVTPEVAELGDVPLGARVVAFEITNPADRPRRIGGLNEGCSGNVCILSRHRGQITVNPGETFRYECDVKVSEPGPFELKIAVFLEDGGIRTVMIGARETGR